MQTLRNTEMGRSLLSPSHSHTAFVSFPPHMLRTEQLLSPTLSRESQRRLRVCKCVWGWSGVGNKPFAAAIKHCESERAKERCCAVCVAADAAAMMAATATALVILTLMVCLHHK